MERISYLTDGLKTLFKKGGLKKCRRKIAKTFKDMDDSIKCGYVISHFSGKLGKGKSLNEEELRIIYLLPEKYLKEFLENLCITRLQYEKTILLADALKVPYENAKTIKENIEKVILKIVDHVEKNEQNYPEIYADIQKVRYDLN